MKFRYIAILVIVAAVAAVFLLRGGEAEPVEAHSNHYHPGDYFSHEFEIDGGDTPADVTRAYVNSSWRTVTSVDDGWNYHPSGSNATNYKFRWRFYSAKTYSNGCDASISWQISVKRSHSFRSDYFGRMSLLTPGSDSDAQTVRGYIDDRANGTYTVSLTRIARQSYSYESKYETQMYGQAVRDRWTSDVTSGTEDCASNKGVQEQTVSVTVAAHSEGSSSPPSQATPSAVAPAPTPYPAACRYVHSHGDGSFSSFGRVCPPRLSEFPQPEYKHTPGWIPSHFHDDGDTEYGHPAH